MLVPGLLSESIFFGKLGMAKALIFMVNCLLKGVGYTYLDVKDHSNTTVHSLHCSQPLNIATRYMCICDQQCNLHSNIKTHGSEPFGPRSQ